jgi:hypothetical protein
MQLLIILTGGVTGSVHAVPHGAPQQICPIKEH